MPWSPKQHRLFEAAAHSKAIAKAHGMAQATASHLAAEGVKKPANPVMHTHHQMEHEMREHAMKTPGKTPGDTRGGKIEPVTHKGKKLPFQARNPNKLHSMFGPGEGHGSGFEKGGGREHPSGGLSYLKGGQDAPLHASPDHFGDREGHDGHYTGEYRSNDERSARMEGNEVGREGMKDNLGSKRKSGYGDPQGGTTTLPGSPEGKIPAHGDGRGPSGQRLPEHGLTGGPRGNAPEEALADETRGTHELPAHQYAAKYAVPQEQREHLARALLHARRR